MIGRTNALASSSPQICTVTIIPRYWDLHICLIDADGRGVHDVTTSAMLPMVYTVQCGSMVAASQGSKFIHDVTGDAITIYTSTTYTFYQINGDCTITINPNN